MGKWKDHHEMSTEEIARELKLSHGSVKRSLKRAMKKLRLPENKERAAKIKELVIVREREAKRQLPRIVEGCIC